MASPVATSKHPIIEAFLSFFSGSFGESPTERAGRGRKMIEAPGQNSWVVMTDPARGVRGVQQVPCGSSGYLVPLTRPAGKPIALVLQYPGRSPVKCHSIGCAAKCGTVSSKTQQAQRSAAGYVLRRIQRMLHSLITGHKTPSPRQQRAVLYPHRRAGVAAPLIAVVSPGN